MPITKIVNRKMTDEIGAWIDSCRTFVMNMANKNGLQFLRDTYL